MTNADRIRAMTDEELADWLKSCAVTMSFCRDIDERTTIVPADVTDNYVGSKSEEGETDGSKL